MSFQSSLIQDFSKGLDLVSSLPNVQPGFTPNAKNFRISEYGGIDKILGYAAWCDLGVGNEAHDLFWFRAADASPNVLIAATATKWFKIDAAGDETAIRTGLTTNTDTTFVAHDDVLYGADGVNVMASWDGTTLTTHAAGVDTGPPLGIILGIWQERMYVAPIANPMRVVFSEPGNFTGTGAWPADNFVDFSAPSLSDKIVAGEPAADGVVVFAQRSTHLIYGTLEGNNRMVDADRGLSSRRSIATIDGQIYGVTGDGVFRTSGGFPLEIVSRAIEPLFSEASADLTTAAGVRHKRNLLFSYDRNDDDENDLTLDYRPGVDGPGSWMANDYPMRAAVTAEFVADELLYFVDGSDPTKVRKGFSGGSFAGADIACFYDLPHDNLGSEQQLKRLHRVRVVGRGDLHVAVREDYASFDVGAQALEFPAIAGGQWNVVDWNEGYWGGYELFEGIARVRGFGRRLQIRLYESSSDTYPSRAPLGASVGDELGGAGAYIVEPSFAISSRHR